LLPLPSRRFIRIARVSNTHASPITKMFVNLLALSVLSSAYALSPITLPIISSPSYQFLSGDVLVQQQLGSWNISIGPISLDLDLDIQSLAAQLRLPLKRDIQSLPDTRRSRTRGLLSNLGLGLGINFGSSHGGGTSLGLDSGIRLGVSSSLGWGAAETPARGEQGDTEVNDTSGPTDFSGSPTFLSARHLNPSPSCPIRALPTSSCSVPNA
jgi:hypothetical protein